MSSKYVTLRFLVPEDLDTPSEVLGKMKQLMLDGLLALGEVTDFTPEELALVKALLIEE